MAVVTIRHLNLKSQNVELKRIATALERIADILAPPAPETEIIFTSIDKFKPEERIEQEQLDQEEIKNRSM